MNATIASPFDCLLNGATDDCGIITQRFSDPDLVRCLQVARRELSLESAIAKLDRYNLLSLDES